MDIKIKEQIKDECAPECLSSTLNYLVAKNKYSSTKIIEKTKPIEWKWRNWDFRMCTFALREKFKATVVHRSTQSTDPVWFKIKNRKTLIEKYKNELSEIKSINSKNISKDFYLWRNPSYEKEEISSIVEFLESRGTLLFKPIEVELIDKILDKKVPIIFAHNSALLHGKKRMLGNKTNEYLGHHWGHVSIISGKDKDNYYITDPLKSNEKTHYYKKNKALIVESIVRFDQNIYFVER